MRVSLLKLFSVCLLPLLFYVSALADINISEVAKMLPDKVGEATARSNATVPVTGLFEHTKAEDFGVMSTALRFYVSPSGETFGVQVTKTQSDAGAYALLSTVRQSLATTLSAQVATLSDVGTAAISAPGHIAFFKGNSFVLLEVSVGQMNSNTRLIDFARSFADTLDKGTGEIPVLVKHLPDWEKAEERAVYAVSLPALREAVSDQPVLDAVSFGGDTEAVTSTYDQARLVIVEFSTPQIAADNDARITERLAQLRGAGQPIPSTYRRIGNYSAFIFGAPDEKAALRLVDQVKYEKDVRWLGRNPHAIDRANRAWIAMSGSVILNTVKATGLAIILCLGGGIVIGGAIFMRRRAQAAATEQFSDAGGMLRLDLDEISAPHRASRLLGQGDK